MTRVTPKVVWIVPSAILAAGCASATSMQIPETVGRKHWQLGIEQSYQGQFDGESVTSYPMVGATVRYGAADRVDVGGTVGPAGLEVSTKVRLTPLDSDTVVSVVPSLGGTGTIANNIALLIYQADLAVLVGRRLPHDLELVVSPRVHETAIGGTLGSSTATASYIAESYVGASVGIAFHALKGRVLPEVGALYPVMTSAHRFDGLGGVTWLGGRSIVQGSVSFLWGGNER